MPPPPPPPPPCTSVKAMPRVTPPQLEATSRSCCSVTHSTLQNVSVFKQIHRWGGGGGLHLKHVLRCACWQRAGRERGAWSHQSWEARRRDHEGRRLRVGGGSGRSMCDSGTT